MSEWKLVPATIDDDALFSDPVCEWINRHYAPQQATMSRPMMKGAYAAMLAASPDPTQDDALALLVARALNEEASRNGKFSSRLTQARAVLAALKGGA